MRDMYPGLLRGDAASKSVALPFSYHLKAELLEPRLDLLFDDPRQGDAIVNARGQFGKAATYIAEGAVLSEVLRGTLFSALLMGYPPDYFGDRQGVRLRDIVELVRSRGIKLKPLSPEEALFNWFASETQLRSFAPERVETFDSLRRSARWDGTTRPHLPAAALLALNGRPVQVGPQLLALAVNDGSDQEVGIDGLCGELWLYESVLEHGCVASRGTGAFKWIATTVLVPAIIACFPKEMSDPFRETWSRIRIEQKVPTLNGTCIVRGDIELNYELLIQEFEESMYRGGRTTACVEQMALTLVGRSPGKIDGLEGPNTQAARQTFKLQWGIVDKRPISKEYVAALTKALRGIQPSSK